MIDFPSFRKESANSSDLRYLFIYSILVLKSWKKPKKTFTQCTSLPFSQTLQIIMASASATESVSANGNLRIIWSWQSNPHSWTDDEPKEWTRYSDFENNYIEEAYQRGQEDVQLNDYIINMAFGMQFKRDDRSRQRPVKREEVDVSQLVRQERFNYSDRAVNTCDRQWNDSHDFAMNWHVNYYVYLICSTSDVAKRAAQGKALVVLYFHITQNSIRLFFRHFRRS